MTVEGKSISAATAHRLLWRHLGYSVNSEACHKNQHRRGKRTVKGTILTKGYFTYAKHVYNCLQKEKHMDKSSACDYPLCAEQWTPHGLRTGWPLFTPSPPLSVFYGSVLFLNICTVFANCLKCMLKPLLENEFSPAS